MMVSSFPNGFTMLRCYVIVAPLFVSTWSFMLEDVARLKRDLFQNGTYDSTFRPVRNQSHVLQVNVVLTITALSGVNLADGTADIIGYIKAVWTDELLAWNVSKYNGVDKVFLRSHQPWAPGLKRPYGKQRASPTRMAVIAHSGVMLWIELDSFRVLCDQDMRYYPFDRHTCVLDIASGAHDASQIGLISGLPHAVLYENISTGGQWRFEGSRAEVLVSTNQGITWAGFRVSFTIARRPEFVMLHIFVPFSLIVFLNLFIYLTPPFGGERVSFAVTLMLAMVFYTTKISEIVPENSMKIAYASMFITMTNMYATASVAISIVLCKIATNTSAPVSPWLVRLISKDQQKSKKSMVHMGVNKRNKITETEKKENEDDAVDPIPDGKRTDEVTWRQVAEYFDRKLLFCYMFVIFVTYFTLGGLLMARN